MIRPAQPVAPRAVKPDAPAAEKQPSATQMKRPAVKRGIIQRLIRRIREL